MAHKERNKSEHEKCIIDEEKRERGNQEYYDDIRKQKEKIKEGLDRQYMDNEETRQKI